MVTWLTYAKGKLKKINDLFKQLYCFTFVQGKLYFIFISVFVTNIITGF